MFTPFADLISNHFTIGTHYLSTDELDILEDMSYNDIVQPPSTVENSIYFYISHPGWEYQFGNNFIQEYKLHNIEELSLDEGISWNGKMNSNFYEEKFIKISFELESEQNIDSKIMFNFNDYTNPIFQTGCDEELFFSNSDLDVVNSCNIIREDFEYIEVPKNPDGYEYYQSKRQSFYYVENVEDMQINDWVLAYNGDILVGARQYIGGMIDVPVMGNDDTDFTAGYCDNGDVPEFKLFRSSTGMLNELSGNVTEWASNTVTVLDNLSLTNMPTEVSLSPAYPNPFNPSTSLSYTVPQDGNVKLSVYDISGRLVENLVSSYQEAGSYNAVWNAANISSGVYFVRLSASSEMLTQKVMLIK